MSCGHPHSREERFGWLQFSRCCPNGTERLQNQPCCGRSEWRRWPPVQLLSSSSLNEELYQPALRVLLVMLDHTSIHLRRDRGMAKAA